VVLPDKIQMVVLAGLGLVAALCIIRWPVSGVYLTTILAILFDGQSSQFVHTLISDADIYRNIVFLNAPEIILALALVSALSRRFHMHRKSNQGPLFWPMMLLAALVIVGETIGLLGGGVFKTSLWEIRPLLYLVVFYILAVNTVSEPRHIRVFLWITIIAIALRCVEGVYRYIIMPADVRSVAEVVLEHDDSLFLVLGIALLPVVAFWRAWLSKWMLYTLVAIAPLIMFVMVINHRRAAYLCLLLVLATSLPLIWLSLRSKEQKTRLLRLLIVGGVLAGVYVAAFWNSTNGGFLAEPAQAIRSIVNPSERDYLSNLYRDIETQNLQFTISTSPVMGIGFGRPFIEVRPLVDLTATWPFQLYMPHNNMLWIWMRTGILGFMNFWAVMGLAILLITASVRLGAGRLKALLAAEEAEAQVEEQGGTNDRHHKKSVQAQKRECVEFLVLVLLAQAVLVSLLGLAQVDQGLMSFRLMMYAGIALGTLAACWNMYGAGARLSLSQLADPGQLPEHEHKKRTRRRVRTLPGMG
jgi:hypothetical protein